MRVMNGQDKKQTNLVVILKHLRKIEKFRNQLLWKISKGQVNIYIIDR